MDTAIGTFQVHQKGGIAPKRGEVRPIHISSLGRRESDEQTVADLVETLRRDGGFLHPPAVRDEGEGRCRLIHGHHRVEAWKRCCGEQTPIPANVYPSDTPDALIAILEYEENLLRKELTAKERQAQTLLLVAALKELNGWKPPTAVSDAGRRSKLGP